MHLYNNTELYAYNNSKTTLFGPVKGENLGSSTVLTIPACKDSTIYIYIIEKNSSTFHSSLFISKSIAGFLDLDNISDQGARLEINTSCMQHVLCFDKMAYAHAVAEIEVGGLQGTGTLINNESNNARPFLLTAFHLIDFNKDNQISSDEIENLRSAAFLVQYWRTTCSGDVLNYGLFFTGAILRAARPTKGGSDMVLLELINGPGLGDGVTYAGWDRATSAPSNSSSFIILLEKICG